MAEMDGTHSQTPNPPLSSVDKIYLPRFLPPLALEDNRSLQIKRNSKRKLEDYLDPVLLHSISSRISRTETKEKQQMERQVVFLVISGKKTTEHGYFISSGQIVAEQTPSKRFPDVDGGR